MYHKTVLKNGVKILSEKMDHFRSVSLGVWVGVGVAVGVKVGEALGSPSAAAMTGRGRVWGAVELAASRTTPTNKATSRTPMQPASALEGVLSTGGRHRRKSHAQDYKGERAAVNTLPAASPQLHSRHRTCDLFCRGGRYCLDMKGLSAIISADDAG